MSSNLFVFRCALIAALGGFIFGFDTVVISGAEQDYQQLWNLGSGLQGWATSAALWGTVLGALLGGWPTDRFGRKATLACVGLLYFVSAVGSALAPEVKSFIAFRFIGGLGVGISTVASPLYISEIAPAKLRGRLTGMFQFNIVFGILIAYASNALFGSYGGAEAWRWMLGIEAFPALAYTLLCFSIPESPRWLIGKRGNSAAAIAVMRRLQPSHSDAELRAKAEQIAELADANRSTGRFWSGRLKVPILLAFLIAFFNQLSGINAILYFAPRIFEWTGLEAEAALLRSVGIGVTNLIFTFVGLWLIDRMDLSFLLPDDGPAAGMGPLHGTGNKRPPARGHREGPRHPRPPGFCLTSAARRRLVHSPNDSHRHPIPLRRSAGNRRPTPGAGTGGPRHLRV